MDAALLSSYDFQLEVFQLVLVVLVLGLLRNDGLDWLSGNGLGNQVGLEQCHGIDFGHFDIHRRRLGVLHLSWLIVGFHIFGPLALEHCERVEVLGLHMLKTIYNLCSNQSRGLF